MKMVGIHIMNLKGFSVLKGAIESSPKSITYVISAQDPAVNKDYFDEIQSLCKASSILFFNNTIRIKLPIVDYKIADG